MTPGPVPETVVAPGPAFTLRILNLSESARGPARAEALWRRWVLGEAWLKNLEVIVGSGRAVDLVCFAGDVAFAGRREEYFALPISCELLRRLGFGPERFFAVPGNRDMDRKIEVAAWRALRDQIGRGMRRTCRNS